MGRELCSGSWSTGLASQEALLWGGCQPFFSLSLIWVFDVLWLAHWINHTFKDHPWQPWPVKMAFVENQCRSLWDNVFALNWSPGSDYVPHHSDEICTLKKYARGRLASIFKVSNGIILSHGEIRLEKKYEMQCRWTALQFESTFLGLTGRYNDLYSILWNIHKTIKDRTSLIQCTDLIIKWTLPVDCCRGALIWNVLRKKLERLFDQCEKYGWWARISCANLQLNMFIF